MFPSPRDLLPIFHCPLCPPATLLSAPTTLRCGHSLCAVHVRSPRCPIPACSSQHHSLTPNIPPSSRVAFFPAPESLPSDDPPRGLDVRINNIIHLLRAPQDLPLRFPDPFGNSDDDSDPDLPSRHRHRPSPIHDFGKALATELTCEICFMLLYQPVTTPCQHVRIPPPPSSQISHPHRLSVQSVSSVPSTTACSVLSVAKIFPVSPSFNSIPTTRSSFPSVSSTFHSSPAHPFPFSPHSLLRRLCYPGRCNRTRRAGCSLGHPHLCLSTLFPRHALPSSTSLSLATV
ncbi:hypothetical protein J3R82DRAFT_4086 [Butyriboletus roseoflavus]|nr:hypothetical protein J3R82DRAFT_4086 [Butyriboletus roseoflavus]